MLKDGWDMRLDSGKSTCLSEGKMYEEIEESHSAFGRIKLQGCMWRFGGNVLYALQYIRANAFEWPQVPEFPFLVLA